MRWRLVVVLLALVAAAVGALGVLRYARGADERALADQRPVEVLVLTAPAAAGTAVETLPVRPVLVPAITVPDDALASLEGLGGRVAAVDLVAGEVLVRTRLVEPEQLVGGTPVTVPVGAQLFTFPVGTDRALGGRLRPGDRIAVYASFGDSPLTSAATPSAEEGEDVQVVGGAQGAPVTKLLIASLLVVDVQSTVALAPEVDSGSTLLAPEGSLWLTVAADVPTVEQLVFGLEFGTVRVARLEDGSVLEGSRLRSPRNVYG